MRAEKTLLMSKILRKSPQNFLKTEKVSPNLLKSIDLLNQQIVNIMHFSSYWNIYGLSSEHLLGGFNVVRENYAIRDCRCLETKGLILIDGYSEDHNSQIYHHNFNPS